MSDEVLETSTLFENRILSANGSEAKNSPQDALASCENFQGSEWLTGVEAAIYLRMLTRQGKPCVERIRNLVHQGRLPSYKPFGRLLFKKSELDRLLETSRKGGFKWR